MGVLRGWRGEKTGSMSRQVWRRETGVTEEKKESKKHSHLSPQKQGVQRERRGQGVGAVSACLSLNLHPLDFSMCNPLHSLSMNYTAGAWGVMPLKRVSIWMRVCVCVCVCKQGLVVTAPEQFHLVFMTSLFSCVLGLSGLSSTLDKPTQDDNSTVTHSTMCV